MKYIHGHQKPDRSTKFSENYKLDTAEQLNFTETRPEQGTNALR